MRRSGILRTLILLACVTVLEVPDAFAIPSVPSGRRLREIVAANYPDGNILIGATTGSWAFGADTGLILDREFSYVTPENDFKQTAIHPVPTSWDWTRADQWIAHVADNEQVLRMHCPIGPQCSVWVKHDSRTPEELETNLREFLTAVCLRYNGRAGFQYMDVVNETVSINRCKIIFTSAGILSRR